ncbi:replication endonuclease [Hafnia sp.]|uniref:replication endonuclease n=1 Tax=Hafnia sp. TaxID=1873498 RepID=UPI002FC76068
MTDTRGRRAPSEPKPYPGAQPENIQYAWPWQLPRGKGRPHAEKFEETLNVDRRPSDELYESQQDDLFFRETDQLLLPLPRFLRLRIRTRILSVHRLQGRAIAKLKLKDILRRDMPIVMGVHGQYATCEARAMTPNDSGLQKIQALSATIKASTELGELTERFNRLPDAGDEDIELLAQDIARHLFAILADIDDVASQQDDELYATLMYDEAAALAAYFRLNAPNLDKYRRRKLDLDGVAIAIRKMMDGKFWYRNLRPYARRWREHLQIAFGDARRKASPYCSEYWVKTWDTNRKRSREYMSGLEIEDEKTGERLSLIEQIDSSVSNPAKRRVELMTRIGGFEKIAKEQGYSGVFFTLTAPSKYHAYTMYGHRNAKWQGISPRKTQRYLTQLWEQIRAELARAHIPVFGIRVAEPHHDGTPHWHGLLFILDEHREELESIMREYATREDAHELKGKHGDHPRFEMKDIDSSVGSATGYIVKYISKNIDGYGLKGELDKETGKPLTLTCKNATAWASLWGIRQFQFLGGAPVSVWRELRRMHNQALADSVGPVFGQLHFAADNAQWNDYVMLQGGPFATRRELALRTYYQPRANPNDYGEQPEIIKGVYQQLENTLPIITRSRTWKIVKKKTDLVGEGVDLDLCLDFDLRDASAASRTRVNNCTSPKKQPVDNTPPPHQGDPEQLDMEQELTKQIQKDLLSNKKITRSPEEDLRHQGYELLYRLEEGLIDFTTNAIGRRRPFELQEEANARYAAQIKQEIRNQALSYFGAAEQVVRKRVLDEKASGLVERMRCAAKIGQEAHSQTSETTSNAVAKQEISKTVSNFIERMARAAKGLK